MRNRGCSRRRAAARLQLLTYVRGHHVSEIGVVLFEMQRAVVKARLMLDYSMLSFLFPNVSTEGLQGLGTFVLLRWRLFVLCPSLVYDRRARQ